MKVNISAIDHPPRSYNTNPLNKEILWIHTLRQPFHKTPILLLATRYIFQYPTHIEYTLRAFAESKTDHPSGSDHTKPLNKETQWIHTLRQPFHKTPILLLATRYIFQYPTHIESTLRAFADSKTDHPPG